MYYSTKVRKQKVKELENNKEFIEYALKQYDIYKKVDGFGGYNTFEEYLVGEVFNLYDNFTMLEFLKNADSKTINRVMSAALKGI